MIGITNSMNEKGGPGTLRLGRKKMDFFQPGN